VLLRKAVQLNGITRLALTKLDVLSKLTEIRLCTHYEINGEKTKNFPTNPWDFERAAPVYETMPGWQADLSGCAKLSDLPTAAQNYINRLKALCYDVPLLLLSLGPERSQTIELEKL
jgi:adenylosuccinate synthase